MQRLGAQSEDSNTNISMPSPSPEKELKESEEPEEQESYKNNEKSTMETNTEESLTPPLLPSMIVKEKENPKENDKDLKVKRNDWDMFADQDIFKENTSVCLFIFNIIHFNCFFLVAKRDRSQRQRC